LSSHVHNFAALSAFGVDELDTAIPLVTFSQRLDFSLPHYHGGTATGTMAFVAKKIFPHQKASVNIVKDFRALSSPSGTRACGMQYRPRLLHLSSQLQIDFSQRRAEAYEARAGRVYRHQREFHQGSAPPIAASIGSPSSENPCTVFV